MSCISCDNDNEENLIEIGEVEAFAKSEDYAVDGKVVHYYKTTIKIYLCWKCLENKYEAWRWDW